jgi:hypothetical protein
MDLDRINVACDHTESNVRIIANRRLARARARARVRVRVTASEPSTRTTNNAPRTRVLATMLRASVVVVVSASTLAYAANHSGTHPLVDAITVKNREPSIELVSMQTVLSKMNQAKAISVAAFGIPKNSKIIDRLRSALSRRAKVSVTLVRDLSIPWQQPTSTERDLETHGVPVHFIARRQGSTDVELVAFDNQLYLSDGQWASRSPNPAVVQYTFAPGDPISVGALLRKDHVANRLSVTKGDALDAEAFLLEHADGQRIRVASDTVGPGTRVYARLEQLGKLGYEVQLLISRSKYKDSQPEHAAVSHLMEDCGVEVRLSSADESHEKMATDGTAVWIGSANATSGFGDQFDFGLVITKKPVVDRLTDHFDREWDDGHGPI